ncbi:Uncharacterised protein [uncultured archaeon]|nr:Uncharacterised protein [uncultured archaeon]
MERCARCKVKSEVVQLYDAVYECQLDLICERCAIIENIPIIKKPNTVQLKESEQGVGVYERMKRISGVHDERRPDMIIREQRLRELDKNPGLESPQKGRPDLIQYFHWEIMRNRRRKGLSQEQLAQKIGVSTMAIEMLEKARIPDNADEIIRRLENFFVIRLIKVSEIELINRMKQNQARDRPVLLDGYGHELDHIPEPEIRHIEEERIIETDDSGNLDLQKTDASRVTINDLKEFHKKRLEVSKQEQREEQKRIEERQRLIEARKEELRSIKEKETKELDSILGGAELLGGDNHEDE